MLARESYPERYRRVAYRIRCHRWRQKPCVDIPLVFVTRLALEFESEDVHAVAKQVSAINLCQPTGHPMIVEVEANDNCDSSFFARFKAVGPARPVVQVRLYDRNPAGEWYWVTGWSDNEQAPACPAYAQVVEDSGAGLAHLIYGGIYGLRFKPSDLDKPWNLASAEQWGEAYLSLADARDLRYAD